MIFHCEGQEQFVPNAGFLLGFLIICTDIQSDPAQGAHVGTLDVKDSNPKLLKRVQQRPITLSNLKLVIGAFHNIQLFQVA